MTHPLDSPMLSSLDGALLVRKPEGISSFGVIEQLQRSWIETYQVKKRDLPKLGHGGTLDPFATGLLIICVGRGVKLARYFLGSAKGYEGSIRFGETTIPGDPTAPISETSSHFPQSQEEVQRIATSFTLQPYLQTPPMHSAKKKDGKPLYELAREGIEVERDPKTCHLYSYEILNYEKPNAAFRLLCSSGTYVRTLTQDLARRGGTVALLETLNRTCSGSLHLDQAWDLKQIQEATREKKRWDDLPCWVPFDHLLNGYDRVLATREEALALQEGRQKVLFNLLEKGIQPSSTRKTPIKEGFEDHVAIYCENRLIAIAIRTQGEWGLERVFSRS